MPKPKKIGKDVTGKKGVGIIQTRKEAEDFEEWKRKRAEDAVKKEKNAEKEQELHGKKITSKMIDEREPTVPPYFTKEEWEEFRKLAKEQQKKELAKRKPKKAKVKVEVIPEK